MKTNSSNGFYGGIVFPSLLAVVMFVIALFIVLIPSVEQSIMNEKKLMISELTQTAWSLLNEYYTDTQNTLLTDSAARNKASLKIKDIRYGKEHKDYFWIINTQPTMVMHPYRSELIGKPLNNYTDANGKKLFTEAVSIARHQGDGYIEYMWQWKDDSNKIVPKLSYVKAFEPWNWVIGTGIYLDDVENEIKQYRSRVLTIALAVIMVVAVSLMFVIRQSLQIENKRIQAENKLQQSRLKYKSLVEASTEGTLMLLNNRIIYSNLKFSKLSGYKIEDIINMSFEQLFSAKLETILNDIKNPKQTFTFETNLHCKGGTLKDVILSMSAVEQLQTKNLIVVCKELSSKMIMEKEAGKLSNELRTTLNLMNQPILCFYSDIHKVPSDCSIQKAIQYMQRKHTDILFIELNNSIIGVVTSNDILWRAVNKKLNLDIPVTAIMSAPVITLPDDALLYEVMLALSKHQTSHIAIKTSNNKYIGELGYKQIAQIQHNTLSYFIKQIEDSGSVSELKSIYTRVPVLVNALVNSSEHTENITRIITSVADAITQRLIELTIEEIGTPPCSFAFMALGSEGREEQTLLTDQDNAIIIDANEHTYTPEVKQYFNLMGEMVCDMLHNIGYTYCKGNVMAKNPAWNCPVTQWKNYFKKWIESSDPKSILDASIFFDFRCVYGNRLIISELRNYIHVLLKDKAVFFYQLSQPILKYKSPVGIFGGISTGEPDNKQLNLKKAILPIICFSRVYGLKAGISETNSMARLHRLYKQKLLTSEMFGELSQAYNYLMYMRFKYQIKKIIADVPPDNNIDISQLTHIELSTLKKVLAGITNLQTKTSFDFKGSM